MTPEERGHRFVELVKPSREKHVEFAQSAIPRFASFTIDTDVRLIFWHKVMHAGAYYIGPLDEEGALPDTNPNVYMLDVDVESFADEIRAEIEGQDKELSKAIEGRPIIHATIKPILIDGKRPITFDEVLTWLAVGDATDEKTVREIVSISYSLAPEDIDISDNGKIEEPDLPIQDAIQPTTNYFPNTKVAQYLTSPALFNDGGALVDVASEGEGRRGAKINTAVSLSYDDYSNAALSAPIDEYDFLVQSGLATAWANGIRTFTARQIATCMSIENPTKAQAEKVRAYIEKQRRIMCSIDFSEEARGRRLSFDGDPIDAYTVEEHLCPAQRHTIRTKGGRKVEGYVMTTPPPIYQHAASVREVVSIPHRLLSVGKGSNTDANLIIKSHVLHRIEQMRGKRGKSLSNRIRYIHSTAHPERLGIFERAGIRLDDRDARKRAADYVLSILDDLVEAKEIRGYSEVKERRQRVAVDVNV